MYNGIAFGHRGLTQMCKDNPSAKEKTHTHKHINKLAGLSRDWVGVKDLLMCFFQVVPYGGETAHKQNPPKILGQSREHFVCVFLYVLKNL